jgi:hypothetical protein
VSTTVDLDLFRQGALAAPGGEGNVGGAAPPEWGTASLVSGHARDHARPLSYASQLPALDDAGDPQPRLGQRVRTSSNNRKINLAYTLVSSRYATETVSVRDCVVLVGRRG